MDSPSHIRVLKYHQAAVFYFGYGIFYLSRIIALGLRSDWNMHGYPRILAWIMIPVGLLITIAFPFFIWRQVRWFTVALAIVGGLGIAATMLWELFAPRPAAAPQQVADEASAVPGG